MTITEALAAADQVRAGSPEHTLARDICFVRGLDPEALFDGPAEHSTRKGLCNWRLLIVEQLLRIELFNQLQEFEPA